MTRDMEHFCGRSRPPSSSASGEPFAHGGAEVLDGSEIVLRAVVGLCERRVLGEPLTPAWVRFSSVRSIMETSWLASPAS